jgi:glycosyltransferase involved in cell wall biosynthesis
VKVAYVVSRFPHVSETFIVRELNELAAAGEFELSLYSLFAAVDPTVHPSARRWVAALRRGRPRGAAAGVARWLLRRPLRTASTAVQIVRAFARSPALMARSLVAFAVAAGHASEIRALGTEHVHAHFATYPALAAWTIWRLTGVGYSFTAHAHDIYGDRSFLARLLRDARFAVAISDYNRRLLERHGGEGTPLHVVHCGVDPDAYAYRPRMPPKHGPVRCLCVASLQEYKGHRHLLDALACGGTQIGRVELDLVGRGELRDPLEQRVAELGLSERVRFHGALTEPEVADLLSRAHLFVLASIVVRRTGFMEGIPVSLMEAMAVGVPVVGSRISGIPELVRDGETGLLAEAQDAAGLHAAVERVLCEDGASTRARLDAARRLVEAQFDVRASGRAMGTLIAAQATGVRRGDHQ